MFEPMTHKQPCLCEFCEVRRLRAEVDELKAKAGIQQAFFNAAMDRAGKAELDLGMAESAHQDDLQEIETLKDALREIYRMRGEDPEVASICNRALSA